MVGKQVAQYQFLEKLGAGGMGEIYKAQDTRLNRLVAVKVLPSAKSGDPERRKRFLLEAQAASGLNHPSIITIHDVISEGDTEFMVMELVSGKTLNDLIPKGGLRIPQALNYALQMADALKVAHAARIVHRDLKPANVMITDSGLVKILDFGLAKLMEHDGSALQQPDNAATGAGLTVDGAILGTVSYMSPEQAQGKKIDTRTDIFSFGATLYEMLTGRHAFEGDSSLSTLSAILRDDVKPIAEVVPDVPPQLDAVIQRCMRKDPDERWQTMDEIQAALSELKRESDSGALYTSRISVSAAPTAPKAPAPTQKTSKAKWIGAIAGIVLVAGVILGIRLSSTRRPAPTLAPKAQEETLTNDGVLRLIEGKVPVDLILDHIHSAKSTSFDLSTTELIRLNNAGVPRAVIDQMRNPAAPLPTQTATGTKTEPLPPAPAARNTSVTVKDGTPFQITLAEAIPADANVGTPIHFTVTDDFRVQGIMVLPKGATVYGEITETPKKRRFLGIGNGKLSFSLSKAQAAGGSWLNVRSLPSGSSDGVVQRPVETPGKKGSKDVAAAAGTEYIAYINGAQQTTLSVK
jgi:serine/threonine-protein kinase